MSTVTNVEAVNAFKQRFGFDAKPTDEGRRLGKAAVYLARVEELYAWAQTCGVPAATLKVFYDDYNLFSGHAEKMSGFQRPDPGQVKAVKNGCKNLEKRIHDACAVQPVPNLPEGINLYVRDIPGLDALPDAQRRAKIAEISDRCSRGAKLFDFLGTFDGKKQILNCAPTKETVLDLSWYLMGKAQTKHGQPFHEGAMSIADPNGVIARFFDLCPDIYPRESSHLRAQQEQKGAQGRGIDNPGNYPAGLNTLLLHSFGTQHGDRRLYLKFESAGSYAFVKKDRREVGRRPENETDKEQSWEHFKSLVGMGYKPGGPKVSDTREGSVNFEVTRAYQNIYDACPPLQKYLDPGKMTSKQDSKGNVTGKSRILALTPGLKKLANSYWDVQTQLENINKAQQSAEMLSDPALAKKFKPLYELWTAALIQADYMGDVAQRLGDEVVLGGDDLKPAKSNLAGGADLAPDALLTMFELFEKQTANTAVLLQGSTKVVPFVYYPCLAFAKQVQGRKRAMNMLDMTTKEACLFVDTQALQFSDCVAGGDPVTGFIQKTVNLAGTIKIAYQGDVEQSVMFQALVNAGCPMGNIRSGADLARHP